MQTFDGERSFEMDDETAQEILNQELIQYIRTKNQKLKFCLILLLTPRGK